jgi:methionine aminotransferase
LENPVKIASKLGPSQLSIFAEMSALAQKYHAINLGQGFPDYNPPQDLLDLVAENMNGNIHQYAPMQGVSALRESISAKMTERTGYIPDPDQEITITAGATQALFTAILALIQPGDEVIVIEPCYDSYRPSVQAAGGKTVASHMIYTNSNNEGAGRFIVDWDDMSSRVTEKTRMIIINSPHNPTGMTLNRADMLRLCEIVRDRNIAVLSDEVYEHLIFDGRVHETVWNYPELRDRSISVHSFGKTFHSTGWKLGYVVAPAYIMAEFRNLHQWNVFSVNSFLQHALAAYLQDSAHYTYLGEFYGNKRNYFREIMAGTKFRMLPCEGTFFQLADYSDISDMDDVAFAKWMTVEHGVTTIPVSVFSSIPSQNRLIRFCFAKTEALLRAAGEHLVQIG